MAIALGTALAISAIASGAGAAAKGVASAKAAKKAAQQQNVGTQAASRYTQQGLGNLQQLYQPYINSGAGAIGTLGRLTTPGAGARFASPGPPNAMPQPPAGNMAMPRGAMPGAGGQRMSMPDGRPVAGPYMMAEGGDFQVNQPTMFVAGEAGPERASFSGAPQSGGAFGAMAGGAMGRPAGGSAMASMLQNRFGGSAPPNPLGLPGSAAAAGPDLKSKLLAKYAPRSGGVAGPRPGGPMGPPMLAPPGPPPMPPQGMPY